MAKKPARRKAIKRCRSTARAAPSKRTAMAEEASARPPAPETPRARPAGSGPARHRPKGRHAKNVSARRRRPLPGRKKAARRQQPGKRQPGRPPKEDRPRRRPLRRKAAAPSRAGGTGREATLAQTPETGRTGPRADQPDADQALDRHGGRRRRHAQAPRPRARAQAAARGRGDASRAPPRASTWIATAVGGADRAVAPAGHQGRSQRNQPGDDRRRRRCGLGRRLRGGRRSARRRQPDAGSGPRRRHRQGARRRLRGQRGAEGGGQDHRARPAPLGARSRRRRKTTRTGTRRQSPKIQIPSSNHSQLPTPKGRLEVGRRAFGVAEVGSSVGIWELGVVGAWDLELGISSQFPIEYRNFIPLK